MDMYVPIYYRLDHYYLDILFTYDLDDEFTRSLSKILSHDVMSFPIETRENNPMHFTYEIHKYIILTCTLWLISDANLTLILI